MEQIISDRLHVLVALASRFDLHLAEDLQSHYFRESGAYQAGATTIGVEIEVRFSSYFPDLYHAYDLAVQPFDKMSKKDQDNFSNDTDNAEARLNLPQRLRETVALGIPRGKDRYWEFAHQPTYHPYTLAEEIYLLQREGLLPQNQCHSLHLTLGGLPMSTDAGILLMILEMLGYTSKQRILSGVNPDKAQAWGRKGRGGMRSRQVAELKLGKTVGVEFRTLELPRTQGDCEELLYTAWFLAETIRRPDLRSSWELVKTKALDLARRNKIDASFNWGAGFENVDMWTELADSLTSMDNSELVKVVKEVINYQDKLSPHNVYLRHGLSW